MLKTPAEIVQFILTWGEDDPDVHVNGMDSANTERLTADLATFMGTAPRVEILHVRDPDSDCDIRVWINGAEVERFRSEDVDPGRGYDLDDWRESTDATRTDDKLSEPFRAAIVSAREDAESSEYINSND